MFYLKAALRLAVLVLTLSSSSLVLFAQDSKKSDTKKSQDPMDKPRNVKPDTKTGWIRTSLT